MRTNNISDQGPKRGPHFMNACNCVLGPIKFIKEGEGQETGTLSKI